MASPGHGNKMGDVNWYRILVRGQLAAEDIETFCPPGFRIEPPAGDVTALVVRTDQSGAIGLVRQLHGFGCVLLLFERKAEDERTHP